MCYRCTLLNNTYTHMYTGPPSLPDPQLHMLNATTLQISWLPPFTWEDYPIVNYTIQIHNRATGNVMNWTINVTSTSVVAVSPVTFNYSSPHGEVSQRCEELVFTVYAVSNIGQSEPGVVNGGFPIGNICTLLKMGCSETPLGHYALLVIKSNL